MYTNVSPEPLTPLLDVLILKPFDKKSLPYVLSLKAASVSASNNSSTSLKGSLLLS